MYKQWNEKKYSTLSRILYHVYVATKRGFFSQRMDECVKKKDGVIEKLQEHPDDRVVEMINGVKPFIHCTTTLSDPSQRENDLQSVGSGKTVSEKFLCINCSNDDRSDKQTFLWQWITVVCARLKFLILFNSISKRTVSF